MIFTINVHTCDNTDKHLSWLDQKLAADICQNCTDIRHPGSDIHRLFADIQRNGELVDIRSLLSGTRGSILEINDHYTLDIRF